LGGFGFIRRMLVRKLRSLTTLVAGFVLVPLLEMYGQQASAPAQLAPVTVTGQAVAAIPQADSSAATIVSGQEVEVGEVNSFRDLDAQTPNFSVFDANNQRTPKFSVRGFRENNFGAGEPVVGFYVDDIPYYDMYSRGVSLYDVREMEFVRGDQGTLYGASGVGGVVNIVTRQPGNETHGYLEASYGNYDSQDYQLGIGGALVNDKLFFSLDGLYGSRSGFVYNNYLGDDPNTENTADGRATLRWTPSAPWSITLTAQGYRDNDGFVPTYLPVTSPFFPGDANPFSVSRDVNGYVDTYDTDEALRIAYESGSVKVTSVTTHRDWRQDLLQDFDFSQYPIEDGYSYPRLQQWSEELRIESPESADKLKWRAGFYYLNDDLHSDSGAIALPNTNAMTLARSQDETYALFGQATYSVSEHLDLTAGGRFTDDQREILRTGTVMVAPYPAFPTGAYDSSASFTSVQPKAAVTWHFTPDAEIYLSGTEGYQSGGFNSSVDLPSQSQYGPERSWQLELGGKTSWFDNKLSANAALFYTDANNYQTYRINPSDPAEAYLLNAHRAQLYGAELELTARPVEGLDLSAGVGYTYAHYVRFTIPTAESGTGGPEDLDGKPISFVPEFTANLSARYRLPWWHLYVHGEVIGVGRYQLDDAADVTVGQTAQDAYVLVNAQAGYEGGHFNIYFFAKNIFDQHYINNALNLAAGPLVLQTGDPATYGVAATARF
jgi:iron complex outermembrane receptor protein